MITVEVGYTTVRPVIPDQHTSWVLVGEDRPVEAQLIAAQIVASHCEMVTSTRLVRT
ncbi:hypothetical protein G1H11_14050 [Phytoactinopolyspora alkaliphila]|uniref:Uncharacterized protein n=1 Tax=Phytoactinopolyspora alkaliphila TaxID=1783498 RepID=A0A6N9YNL3_9ACTN|nr:hypothetical protein [Phytoactinopolyspora alkaliphila]NED96428.1 hypothetical protein [Phytoactinopolyspora alkaliphila]